jgi:hypothetical protein
MLLGIVIPVVCANNPGALPAATVQALVWPGPGGGGGVGGMLHCGILRLGPALSEGDGSVCMARRGGGGKGCPCQLALVTRC